MKRNESWQLKVLQRIYIIRFYLMRVTWPAENRSLEQLNLNIFRTKCLFMGMEDRIHNSEKHNRLSFYFYIYTPPEMIH